IEDKKALIKTSELYGGKLRVRELTRRLVDVREEFKKKTKGKMGDQGLLFLKKVCDLGDEVKHNALSDAVDLADIYDTIMRNGYSEDMYERLMKERDEIMHYKRCRNVKDEHSIVAPNGVIKAKDIVVAFLQKYKVPKMNEGTKRAIIDDLETLLVKK
ncbi:MAG: hypothetical protein MJ151_02615, partial [Lachnospiraceae bacterium]|nr:hypothetical protein [Lachnospiraceae bacterium]